MEKHVFSSVLDDFFTIYFFRYRIPILVPYKESHADTYSGSFGITVSVARVLPVWASILEPGHSGDGISLAP